MKERQQNNTDGLILCPMNISEKLIHTMAWV